MAPHFERELMGNVLVTGGSGFLGSRLKLIKPDWIYASSKDCNLLDFRDTLRFVSQSRSCVLKEIFCLIVCVIFDPAYSGS